MSGLNVDVLRPYSKLPKPPGNAGFLDLSILLDIGEATLKYGPTAVRFLGAAITVRGAYNEAVNSYESVPAGPWNLPINKGLAAVDTFAFGVAAGVIDDAMFATGYGAPVVAESYEYYDSGPAQHMVGNAMRWLGKL